MFGVIEGKKEKSEDTLVVPLFNSSLNGLREAGQGPISIHNKCMWIFCILCLTTSSLLSLTQASPSWFCLSF